MRVILIAAGNHIQMERDKSILSTLSRHGNLRTYGCLFQGRFREECRPYDIYNLFNEEAWYLNLHAQEVSLNISLEFYTKARYKNGQGLEGCLAINQAGCCDPFLKMP